jgi:hypothetical protein
MSVIAALDRPIRAPVMRLLVMTLTFVCVGPAIQGAFEALLTACYLVFSGWDDEIHFTVGIAPRFLWQMFAFAAIAAGITGLFAGICEILFGRLQARGMFAVSLVIPVVLVMLLIATTPAFRAVIGSGNAHAAWIFLGPTAIDLLSFVASMMTCWKLVDTVRGKTPRAKTPRAKTPRAKTPAAGSLAPP